MTVCVFEPGGGSRLTSLTGINTSLVPRKHISLFLHHPLKCLMPLVWCSLLNPEANCSKIKKQARGLSISGTHLAIIAVGIYGKISDATHETVQRIWVKTFSCFWQYPEKTYGGKEFPEKPRWEDKQKHVRWAAQECYLGSRSRCDWLRAPPISRHTQKAHRTQDRLVSMQMCHGSLCFPVWYKLLGKQQIETFFVQTAVLAMERRISLCVLLCLGECFSD